MKKSVFYGMSAKSFVAVAQLNDRDLLSEPRKRPWLVGYMREFSTVLYGDYDEPL